MRDSEIERNLVAVKIRLQRALREEIHYIAQSEKCGHPHGYSVIQIPDWEVRQIISEVEEALGKEV